MSLDSTNQSFVVSTSARPHNTHDDVQLGEMPEVYVSTKNCSLEGSKQAFLKAMEEFANTPHFEWLVYGFESEFEVKVKHSVALSMNR